MDTYKGIIYCATSPSNKKYYGLSTFSLVQRKKGHIYNAFIKNIDTYFYNALRKYGFDFFNWEIIEKIESNSKENLLKQLIKKEISYIYKNNTYDRRFGYNSTYGGDIGPNKETIEKIKYKNIEKWKDPEYRAKQIKNIEDPIFQKKFKEVTINLSDKISGKIKEKWKDPIYREIN
jgi:hypothetical protein